MTAPSTDGRPRLRDVAALAGVSSSTASRALSGSRAVQPELVVAVQRAADRLRYRVNPIGRALRAERTGTIGVVLPDIVNPFFPELVQSLERALHTDGRSLFLCDANDDVEVERSRIEALLDRRVDGLIISPVHRTASAAAVTAAAEQVPLVQVDRSCEGAPCDYVGVDQAEAMRLLVEHLRAQGRRQLAFVAADESVSTIAERIQAYERLAPNARSRRRVLRGDLSVEWGSAATDRLLAEAPPPDAIVCANDLIALGAMQRLRSLGVAVPDDVAVTGFDDVVFGRISEPTLTSVRQPTPQLASDTVRLLDLRRQAAGPSAARRLVLPPELVVRRSSARDAP